MTDSSAPPLLEARGLAKSYGRTTALAGVDLAVRVGESIAIMGPSGSGKTTLLHCLAGILTPDTGTVMLHAEGDEIAVSALNESARSQLRRTRFGFVFQQGLLIPELTAVENAALPLMLGGMRRAEAESRAADALAALGLQDELGRRIGQLSGGQAQRVAIARAQVAEPAVVFADEPTGALDSATSLEVMSALLESTVGRGRTLVLVTHDEDVAARCHRVVQIRDGRVAQTLTRVGDAGIQFIQTPGSAQ